MADTPTFRTRIAARGWVSRVSSKLEKLCQDPSVNLIEQSDAISEFDIRINRLDDTQTAVELEIDMGDIERDINNAAAFRCRYKFLPAVKFFPPPVTLPSVLSAVCIAQN